MRTMRLVADGLPMGGPPLGPAGRRRVAGAVVILLLLELCAGAAVLVPAPGGAPTVRARAEAAAAADADADADVAAGAAGAQAGPAPRTAPSVTDAVAVAAIRGLLDRRAAALLRRDRAGWLADLDPRHAAFRSRQAAVFDNLAAVPLASWRYEVDPARDRTRTHWRATYGGRVWAPAVTLRYALSRVDGRPTARPQVLVFTHRGGRWYLAADDQPAADGTRTWHGLWDFGPVLARRGRSSLVLGHPSQADRLGSIVRTVDEVVPQVSRVWGRRWRQQVAVLVPASQQEMARVVGERLALAQIAAVAVADEVDTAAGTATGQRVVLNPANLDRLGALGRRVVLRHEVTHVIARGITGEAMPEWLVEGFADYVGYLSTGLPPRVIARDLAAAVRAGRWDAALPTDADFRGAAAGLSVAYEESWFACRLLARRLGTAGLVRFYRMVAAAPGAARAAVDRALRRLFGSSYAGFVTHWRAAVRAELG
jgi:hypothetical protein